MIIVKNPKQIEGIRKSCKLAASALTYIEQHVKEGVSTGYLDKLLEKFIRDNGAIPAPLGYHGYPKATCISLNEVICHGIPSDDRILKNGDILNIDVTTILNGYYGDTSRMYTVGEISEEAKKLIEVTKKCLDIGIQQVRPGNYFGNIGYEIAQYAHKMGYSVVEAFAGHGCGIRFHESPQICHIAPKDSGERMRKGFTFTIEPMICVGIPDAIINEIDGWTAVTKDGKLSAQFEHTILVGQTGYEILTGGDGC